MPWKSHSQQAREEIDWPPEAVIDPEGNEWEVVGTEGLESLLKLGRNGEEKTIDWLTVSATDNEWKYLVE